MYLSQEELNEYIMSRAEEGKAELIRRELEKRAAKEGKKFFYLGGLNDCGCMKVIFKENRGYVLLKMGDRGRISRGNFIKDKESFMQDVMRSCSRSLLPL